MLEMLATVAWLFGALVTVRVHGRSFQHADDASLDSTGECLTGTRHEWAAFTWAMVCSLLWPFYWTGRLLYAIPEKLMLPPGESR